MGLQSPLPASDDSDPFRIIVPPFRTAPGDAELRVDLRHPFFFDHWLDHVPGMMLVTGLLDLVRASGGRGFDARAGRRIRLDLTFGKICELDGPVALSADQHGSRTVVSAVQDGAEVCGGSVELVGDDTPTVAGHGGDAVTPIAAHLVRRSDPRNVLLGAPENSAGYLRVPLHRPADGHFLLRNGEERYAVEELVEAGRQCLTVASYGVHGHSSDTRMLWAGVTADLPVALHRSVPLELHWEITPRRGNTATFDFSLVSREMGHPIGSLRYVVKSCTAVAYQRLRERRWAA